MNTEESFILLMNSVLSLKNSFEEFHLKLNSSLYKHVWLIILPFNYLGFWFDWLNYFLNCSIWLYFIFKFKYSPYIWIHLSIISHWRSCFWSQPLTRTHCEKEIIIWKRSNLRVWKEKKRHMTYEKMEIRFFDKKEGIRGSVFYGPKLNVNKNKPFFHR